MLLETLTDSQALRVVGQHLHGTDFKSFELNKKGDEYVVRIELNAVEEGPSSEPRLNEKILGFEKSAKGAPTSFHFTILEIARLDIKGRLRRVKPGAMPDSRNMSIVLRVIGDYLDRKAAGDFAISWSTYSVKVYYDRREQSFSAQNIYDLGILMYLRSSNHSRKAGDQGTKRVASKLFETTADFTDWE